jgi:transcriptional regulator with XRE-family HTH domain
MDFVMPNENMQAGLTSYSAIVGQVLFNLRQERDIKQGDIAAAVNIGQSTWSRIEKGEVALSIDQLARAAGRLACLPSDVLKWADQAAAQIQQEERVEVLNDRPIDVKQKSNNTGALLLGAGALAAMIWASRKK